MPLTREQESRKVPAKHRKEAESKEEQERLEKLLDKIEEMTTKGHLKDIAYHFTNKREVIKTNLLAGMARGVGLTVGTAIFIGLLVLILTQIVSLPIVGEYIAGLLDMIDTYRTTD
ncbi:MULTISPECIES: DUF5665 domain-containing protein [Alteribacter]|uniref:Uncharacterized protein n=1 Tax=Alteribacter keqinensis TaxID=2483800 RepID=A0A3M7TMR5_9BACI|nr:MULTISPECIES: DUF5665 domain-containing protein [Alteribacter]MBM7094948.1 hypothetical protein [Alteribacter salitolerans]RNA66752.1 hypothetical protein EBO34_16190 [Alteribacter keqinensis]